MLNVWNVTKYFFYSNAFIRHLMNGKGSLEGANYNSHAGLIMKFVKIAHIPNNNSNDSK